MEPIKITAKVNSFMASDPWTPSIDSIIAYWSLFEKLGAEEFHLAASRRDLLTPINELPLERFEWGDHWWWKCSSPVYEVSQENIKNIHRRYDRHEAETYMKPKKGNIPVQAGPYKNFRGSYKQIITDSVNWFVVGDQSEIERLLKRCTNIGAKTGAGHGLVKEWIIEKDHEATLKWARRPTPLKYMKGSHIETPNVLDWAYKPPFRLPENKTLCAMP